MLILISFVLCAMFGAFIAERAEITGHPELLGILVGGIFHVLGLAILVGVWVWKVGTGQLAPKQRNSP